MKKTYLQRIAKIRTEVLGSIKEFLESRKVTELHIAPMAFGDCPVIVDGDEDWDTYTLDKISIQTNPQNTLYRIWLDASSSDDSVCVAADDINLELLCDLVDWLEDNAEEIDEYLAEE